MYIYGLCRKQAKSEESAASVAIWSVRRVPPCFSLCLLRDQSAHAQARLLTANTRSPCHVCVCRTVLSGTETLDPTANLKSKKKLSKKKDSNGEMTSRSVILVQCLWCLALVECARVVPTEAEKQSAFEQLLGKTGRLRMQSSYQSFDPLTTTTTTLPPARPSTTPIMLSDEEAKRHDRRHAVLPQKKHNHKKNHSKRLHHAG